jgi:nitrogen fixation protein
MNIHISATAVKKMQGFGGKYAWQQGWRINFLLVNKSEQALSKG